MITTRRNLWYLLRRVPSSLTLNTARSSPILTPFTPLSRARMPRPAPPLLLSSQNSVVSLARARYCLVAERRVSPSGGAASNAHRVGTRSSAATGVHLPSRPMMNSPHTLSRSPGRIFGPGAGSEETFATLAPDTQRSSIGIRWSWTRTSRALGRAPGGDVSGRRVGCAREVRGWGCGVVASRGGLVPGRGRGRERGGREGNSRETHVAGSGVPRCGAAADRGRGGEAGRATWATTTERSRAGRSRAPVQGRRRALGLCAGRGAASWSRSPPRSASVDRTWRGRRPVVSFRRARLRGRATRLIAALETATLAGRDLDTALKNFPLNNRPALFGSRIGPQDPLARFSADLADEPSRAPVSLSAAWRLT